MVSREGKNDSSSSSSSSNSSSSSSSYNCTPFLHSLLTKGKGFGSFSLCFAVYGLLLGGSVKWSCIAGLECFSGCRVWFVVGGSLKGS